MPLRHAYFMIECTTFRSDGFALCAQINRPETVGCDRARVKSEPILLQFFQVCP